VSDEYPIPVTSSVPVVVPEEQQKLFRQVLIHLNERNVPCVVSGAVALQKHTGICRFTKDLDLFLPAQHVTKALQSLRADGFRCEVPDPVWLAKAHQGEFFVDLISGMSNAVIVVDQGWIDRAHPSEVFGVQCKVLAPEELIASKLFVTRRERFDGADIAHVIFCTGSRLDWSRLLELIGEHWELLLWALVFFHYIYPRCADVVPRAVWEDLVQRFQKKLAHPDSEAPFRGSLIDPNMFAIDVNEWGMEDILEEYRRRREPKISDRDLDPAA